MPTPTRKASSPAPAARASRRPSKSPTPSAKKSAAAASPAKKTPAKETPAKGAAAAESSTPPESTKAKAATTANGNGKAAATPSAAAPTPSKSSEGTGLWLLIALVFVLLGLVVAQVVPADQVMSRLQALVRSPKKVSWLSPKAFTDSNMLRGNEHGSALIAFTSKDKFSPCTACTDLNKLFKSEGFKQQNAAWEGVLKIGAVDCDKWDDLCQKFGVTGLGEETAEPGVPHIVWFKGGKEVEGGFDGERTLEGFRAWVDDKKAAGSL